MDEERKQVISDALLNILEDTAFVFAEPAEDGYSDILSKCRGVKILYSGDTNGKIILCGEESFMSFVAANMLGLDESEESAVEKGLDAFKEMLNIMAGNVITTLYGDEPIYDLEIPEEITEQEKKEAIENNEALWFDAEGKKIAFIMEE